jgi:hypothetical protein
VVAIEADAMTDMQRRRSATNQDAARHEMLDVPLGRKQTLPVWKPILRDHARNCDMVRGRPAIVR